MPFTKKKNFSKKPFVKKKYGNNYSRGYGYKKLMLYKPKLGYGSQIYYFKRWSAANVFSKSINDWNIAPDGTYKALFVYPDFKLDNCPDFQEFTRLFRYYRINAVKVRCQFSWEGAHNVTTIDGTQPQPIATFRPNVDWRAFTFYDKGVTRDWSDPTAGNATLAQAKQFDSFKMHSSTKCIKAFTHPQATIPLNQDAEAPINLLPAGMANVKWLRTQNPNVVFKGFVVGVQPVIPNANLSNYWRLAYTLDYCYYLSFKGCQ